LHGLAFAFCLKVIERVVKRKLIPGVGLGHKHKPSMDQSLKLGENGWYQQKYIQTCANELQ
jgi:hypothetical protein